MSQIAAFELRKSHDGFPRLLLRDPQIVKALEIQPKFSARAEEMAKAQGSVARDGACSVQDLRNPVGRNVDLPCPLSRAHMECSQFFS